MNKLELRRSLRAQRRSLPDHERQAEQEALDGILRELHRDWNGAFAAYMAIDGECTCQSLLDSCWQSGQTVWLPRVSGRYELSWHPVCGEDELAPGSYQILEPQTAAGSLPDSVLMLVPGVAFTAAGERLGMGGGFYDRLLAGGEHIALRIGLCWSCQLLDSLPMEEHDQRVDVVVAGGQPTQALSSLLRQGS